MSEIRWLVLLLFLFGAGACVSAPTTASRESSEKPAPRVYPVRYDEAFLKVMDVVNALNWKVKSASIDTGKMLAETRIDMRGLGDEVVIVVARGTGNTVTVSAVCKQGGDDTKDRHALQFLTELDRLLGELP